MRQVAYSFIFSYTPIGDAIGLVQFSTDAREISPLTDVQGEDDRLSLISVIPNEADGSTCIQCGVKIAISVSSNFFLFRYNLHRV